jgi:O-acetyl-ADP-ribose deacetylase (regulator of RNase III)
MTQPLRLMLCDCALPMVQAWQAYFGHVPNVEVMCDDIASVDADALLAPVSSFGRVDGGLDSESLSLLGEEFESELQAVIRSNHDGELVVGLAEILITRGSQFPFVVCAPIARTPQNVSRTVNSYLAMRAALLAVGRFNELHGDVIGSLVAPGLGVGNGLMPPLRAARQMRAAYDTVMFGSPPSADISLDAAVDSDDKTVVRVVEANVPGVAA